MSEFMFKLNFECVVTCARFSTLQKKHHVLQGVHPSPLSAYRGFFGCKHFSKCNELLIAQGKNPIDWSLFV